MICELCNKKGQLCICNECGVHFCKECGDFKKEECTVCTQFEYSNNDEKYDE